MKIKEFMRCDLFNEVVWYNIARWYHRRIFKTTNCILLIIQIKVKTFFHAAKVAQKFFFRLSSSISSLSNIHLRGLTWIFQKIQHKKPVSFLNDESKNSWMASRYVSISWEKWSRKKLFAEICVLSCCGFYCDYRFEKEVFDNRMEIK